MTTDLGRPVPGLADPGRGRRLSGEPVLSIRDLSIVYRTLAGDVRAVDDVSLDLHPGEIVGLVGESGSGKSTLAYGATRLLRAPAVITNGSVRYAGRRLTTPTDVLQLTTDQLTKLRWREIAIVFQSAMNALNPVLSVHDQLTDVIRAHLEVSRRDATSKAAGLLDLVGIPRTRLRSYPHELSGGMRQRVMIAMALATDPEVVIMDEPTTALDVVVQREILGQILDLKDSLGFAILFITHDLSLLLELADRIAVMYAGQLMEVGTAVEIHHEPAHPYTKRLLRSFPSLRGPRRELTGIPGTPPDLLDPPPGCPFLPRCTEGTDACTKIEVRLARVRTSADPDHLTACPFVLPDPELPDSLRMSGAEPAVIAAASQPNAEELKP
ncbi:MAG TPA: ABC transporter ATP-binding protein [Streptosporangiaceae bacterium]|nr:ABC transporter ATP-binding protein [Streptosporangiaceae bacterium]